MRGPIVRLRITWRSCIWLAWWWWAVTWWRGVASDHRIALLSFRWPITDEKVSGKISD